MNAMTTTKACRPMALDACVAAKAAQFHERKRGRPVAIRGLRWRKWQNNALAGACRMTFNSSQELIDDLRLGRMVVLADAEDRENEGDLVIAADFVTPDAINFMATHARGLICLTLTEERCRQ